MRMPLYQHLRYLFISILCILNFTGNIYILAQHQLEVSLKDLPTCAISCVNDAASAAGCQTNDTLCLCANLNAISISTIECLSPECRDSMSLIEGILSDICNDTTTNSSSTSSNPSNSSTSIQSSQNSTTTSSTSTSEASNTSTTSRTTTTSPTTTSSTTSFFFSLGSPTSSELASSTVFIVKTVFLTPSSTPTSGAGRPDVSFSTRALFFSLSSLMLLVAAI